MSDRPASHDISDLAALYSLGVLTQHEARAFEEHLAEGCQSCAEELRSFELTVGAIGLGSSEAQPPAAMRAQLLSRVAESGSDEASQRSTEKGSEQFVSILDTDGDWLEVQKGVLVKRLYVDKATGIATSLLRMLPGTSLPVHKHLGVEQFLILEGDCVVAGQKLGSGDYHRAAAGSTHQSTYTEHGTLLLLIAPECYEVLDAQ
jgi:anti-sigma factor ChrR (cupin superfamily)